MDYPTIVGILQATIAFIALAGIYFTFSQAKEAKRTNRAMIVLKLGELWSDKAIYEAISYIHSLRAEWKLKEKNHNNWDLLAETWVKDHKPIKDKSHSKDWIKRRMVSQLLNQMHHLMACGYILEEDLFGIIPETKRLLIVLIPIEKAIHKEFSGREIPIDSWDIPFMKSLGKLELRFDKWYLKFRTKK